MVHSGDLAMAWDELPGFSNLVVPSCNEERDFTN